VAVKHAMSDGTEDGNTKRKSVQIGLQVDGVTSPLLANVNFRWPRAIPEELGALL